MALTLAQQQAIAMASARARASQATPPAQDAMPNPVLDAVRSIPGGLAKGVASIGGMGGDIRELATSLLPKNVGDAVNTAMRPLPPTFLGGSTSNELNDTLSAPTGGYYKPQTDAGRFSETAASFAPAVIGGPESLGTRILQRAVLPAAGATIGKDIGGDTGALVGTLAGGVAPAGLRAVTSSLASTRAARAAIPSIAQLKAAATQAYQTVDNSGMTIAAPAVQRLAGDVKTSLTNMGVHPALQPRAMAAFNALDTASGNNQTLQGMEILKRIANQAAQGTMDKSDKMMSRVIGDHIDDFVQNLGPSDVIGNVDKPALDALGDARDLWGRASKAQVIQDTIDKAQNNARSMKANLPALGSGDALRTAFRQLSNNARAISRFAPTEQAAIRRVAQGGPVEQVMRLVGKLSPDQVIPMMSEGAGALLNPGVALGSAAAGLAGKIGSNAITSRNARLASELVRSGGMFGARTTAPPLAPALLRGAAQAAPALGILSAPMLANVTN